jgi:FAD/FMN-containing dehydrogenase
MPGAFVSLVFGALVDLAYLVQADPQCKAVPGGTGWPPPSAWDTLNATVSGNLIATIPPGAVCHPEQIYYNSTTCAEVAKLWTTSWAFHSDNPVSVAENNWTNDSCLPDPHYPCSGVGYPVYVINASKPEHVRSGIHFARENKIRLVVKGTGHDFRGRTVAPYSLSIWTRNLRGLFYHHSYHTCRSLRQQDLNRYSGPALTISAGENLGAAFAHAHQHGSMILVGSSATVGVGGFLTGGGQSLLSPQKGLAVDSVLEATLVLPSGEIVTANACQNADIFWAVRGGGGGTLGVVLSFTVKAFLSEPITSLSLGFQSPTLHDDKFWEAMTYMAAQFPLMSNSGVTVFASLIPGNATIPSIFQGTFQGLNQSTDQTTAIIKPLAEHFNSSYGSDIQAQVTNIQDYSSYYDWFVAQQSDATTPLGLDLAFGSRILDEKALKHSNLSTLLRKAAGTTGVAFNGVAGPGTHAYPGDFNAATPAWRTGYVHTSTYSDSHRMVPEG